MPEEEFSAAAKLIEQANYGIAFTGAGISVESGIPPFRGQEGLWNKYDPSVLAIDYFYQNPAESWRLNKKIFYDVFKDTAPNRAHEVLAGMEKLGYIEAVVTQNIDNLHQEAGSRTVYEFHGNARQVVCTSCDERYQFSEELLTEIPPHCRECGGLLKPDFIFFGEPIPESARKKSFTAARKADLVLVIGTTGEVQPAAMIPVEASNGGARIIEINTKESNYTSTVTDIFLQGKATLMMDKLNDNLADK